MNSYHEKHVHNFDCFDNHPSFWPGEIWEQKQKWAGQAGEGARVRWADKYSPVSRQIFSGEQTNILRSHFWSKIPQLTWKSQVGLRAWVWSVVRRTCKLEKRLWLHQLVSDWKLQTCFICRENLVQWEGTDSSVHRLPGRDIKLIWGRPCFSCKTFENNDLAKPGESGVIIWNLFLIRSTVHVSQSSWVTR